MTEAQSGPQLLAGRYVLQRELGRGGMATVHEGHDRRLDRRVAIKVVPVAATEPTARERFVREAQSAARLFHPNVVTLFDAGEADGFLYIVMEFVEGRTLADELKHGGRIEVAKAATIAASVLTALGHVHGAGLVHRDVKPSNIMLSDDGTVKLVDFGIARRLDDLAGSLTKVGGIVGTPKYLAPEQVDGRPATPASDLYAVGVVLFEMLTGAPPFDGESPVATALAHAVAPVPDVSSVRNDLPETLVRALDQALAKDPADRFATATEMRHALTPTHAMKPGYGEHDGAPEPTRRMPPSPPRPGVERAADPGPARPREATQIFPAGGYRRRRPAAWWLLSVAALSVVAAVLVWAVVRTDPEESIATPTTAATASAAVAAPSSSTTTTSANTTTAPRPATTTLPTTLDGVIATLQADPDAYGRHTDKIIDELTAIQEGDKPQKRAEDLLEKVTKWVNADEATPATLSMLEAVLTPVIESATDDEDEEDNDGNVGNGNGNGKQDE